MSDATEDDAGDRNPPRKPGKKRRRPTTPAVNRSQDSSNRRTAEPTPPRALSSDEILRAMGQMPGLIAMRILTPVQANAMRGVYGTMLQANQRMQSRRDEGRIDDPDIMQHLREHPFLLNTFEPFLTDQQIASIMEEYDEDEEGGQA